MLRFMYSLAVVAACAVVLAACGDGLGECQELAAAELVFGRHASVATKGQALTHDSCGAGAFCHSVNATGAERFGAPAGMNFDMMPAPTGWLDLFGLRSKAWDLVKNDHMPPGEIGHDKVGDGAWIFDFGRRDGFPQLPPLSTKAGKAAFRNWLACGAPVVKHARLPEWSQAPGMTTHTDPMRAGVASVAVAAGASRATSNPVSAQNDEWGRIFEQLIEPSCATTGCHQGSEPAGMLRLDDRCQAHAQLLDTGPCRATRVVPGDAGSLLIDKIESDTPSCGQRMPPAVALRSSDIEQVRAWVLAGAKTSGCP